MAFAVRCTIFALAKISYMPTASNKFCCFMLTSSSPETRNIKCLHPALLTNALLKRKYHVQTNAKEKRNHAILQNGNFSTSVLTCWSNSHCWFPTSILLPLYHQEYYHHDTRYAMWHLTVYSSLFPENKADLHLQWNVHIRQLCLLMATGWRISDVCWLS